MNDPFERHDVHKTLVSLAAIFLLTVGCSADTSGSASKTTSDKATTKQTTKAPAGPTESEVTAWARTQAGLPASGGYQSTGGWMDYLVGARAKRSNLYITLQVDRSDKGTAERAKKFYVNSLRLGNQPTWAKDVSYVIVEDGAGVVITQEGV